MFGGEDLTDRRDATGDIMSVVLTILAAAIAAVTFPFSLAVVMKQVQVRIKVPSLLSRNIISVAKTAPGAAAAIILETTAAIAAVNFKKAVSFRSSQKKCKEIKAKKLGNSSPQNPPLSPAGVPARHHLPPRAHPPAPRGRTRPLLRPPLRGLNLGGGPAHGLVQRAAAGDPVQGLGHRQGGRGRLLQDHGKGNFLFLVNFILSRIIQVGYLSALHQTNCFPPRKKLL